ncbi:hypothetical protein DPMN_048950 [Dreissena polymorpha]|uniref:Uncharacterized protein n=1 Tax=Dreissena polymorpha TaxID=45954 RepID=A0A9D4DAX4_DREPO|nr:hypothetical protein DPMN_048950 [Dreissena polymorpha]
MLKLAQTDQRTDQQTDQRTDQQTGQKQYVPHYYSYMSLNTTATSDAKCEQQYLVSLEEIKKRSQDQYKTSDLLIARQTPYPLHHCDNENIQNVGYDPPAKICSRNWNGSGTVLEHQEQF